MASQIKTSLPFQMCKSAHLHKPSFEYNPRTTEGKNMGFITPNQITFVIIMTPFPQTIN